MKTTLKAISNAASIERIVARESVSVSATPIRVPIGIPLFSTDDKTRNCQRFVIGLIAADDSRHGSGASP